MNKKNIIKYLSVSNILLVLVLLPFLVLFKLGGTYGEDGAWCFNFQYGQSYMYRQYMMMPVRPVLALKVN